MSLLNNLVKAIDNMNACPAYKMIQANNNNRMFNHMIENSDMSEEMKAELIKKNNNILKAIEERIYKDAFEKDVNEKMKGLRESIQKLKEITEKMGRND